FRQCRIHAGTKRGRQHTRYVERRTTEHDTSALWCCGLGIVELTRSLPILFIMTNSDLILANVSKHIELDDKERDYFLSVLEQKVLKKRKVYLRQGAVCRHVAFVLKGALKSYKVDDEGKEHILNFALRDWWIADLYSFISQKPAVLNIETIEESEVFLLSQKDQEALFGKIPKFERFFRILVENALVASQQRLIDNMSLTAE